MPLLSICVPVYNEQDNIPLLHQAVVDVCDPKQIDFELLLVDDGSKDNSWAEIEKVSARDPRVRGLKFKFNCGETAASDAGLRGAGEIRHDDGCGSAERSERHPRISGCP